MNALETYLSSNRIRQADFAARVGATQGTISRLVKRSALPSLELAARIERETGGAVLAVSWIAAPEQKDDAA